MITSEEYRQALGEVFIEFLIGFPIFIGICFLLDWWLA